MAPNEMKTPRWGDIKQLTAQYPIGKTLAYRLLGEGKLRAKKFGGKTVWDLAAADEFFASLPDYDKAA